MPWKRLSPTTMPMQYEPKRIAASVSSRKGLWVPLSYRRGLVGGLFVDDPGERWEFAEEDIRLIEGIAAQAAVALDSARLYEAQANIAATLQQALLHLPPDVPGIRFSHLLSVGHRGGSHRWGRSTT